MFSYRCPIILYVNALPFRYYVLTRWVEKMIPIHRQTTIMMPHRSVRPTLRPSKRTPLATEMSKDAKGPSPFRKMIAIQTLKYGLKHNLYKKYGWLANLPEKEGWIYYFVFDFLLYHMVYNLFVCRHFGSIKAKQERTLLECLQKSDVIHWCYANARGERRQIFWSYA